jgi:hypothetical protein
MVKRLQCLALYNMYTITCFGSNDVVFFLSLGSHVSQHHPSSFLSNITHWSSLSPPTFVVVLEPTRTQQNSRELSNLVKNNWIELGCKEMGAGGGCVGVVTQSYFSSLILVPRVGLPQYPMKSLPPAHNSGLAMPMPLGTFGSLLPAIAPTALLTHLLQAFALHPTSLAALLATLVCREARPEWKKLFSNTPNSW